VLKIDAVVVRGTNEDELADLIEFGKRAGAEVRFIEYMDVGGATQWSRSKVVSRAEILDALSRRYGRPSLGEAPAPALCYTTARWLGSSLPRRLVLEESARTIEKTDGRTCRV
jgi:molybdenum cofactor biosynthesis enzyme MoaA